MNVHGERAGAGSGRTYPVVETILESRIEARRLGENIAWFADLADEIHDGGRGLEAFHQYTKQNPVVYGLV